MSRSCFSCATNLVYGVYYSQHGQSFCTSCYEAQYCKTCVRCNQKIKAGQQRLEWKNTAWHDSCFNCTQCNKSLLPWSSSFEKNNLPYCSNCYNLLFSPKCDKCGGIIESGTSWITVKGEKLHPRCFTCSQCNAPFANQVYYEHNGISYCSDCDTRLFSPKCAWCNQIIHRGTRYLSVDGQTIHTACFTCFTCGQVIEGFHQKKNGHNYHPHCIDNSHFRERRPSYHGAFYNDRTLCDQANYSHHPAGSTQETVNAPFTNVTPLNLRSSTAKNTRLQRSTSNLPNFLNTVTQSNDEAVSETSQEAASDTAQKSHHINKLPDFPSQMSERARTAARRRFSDDIVETKQIFKKETTKDSSPSVQPDEHVELPTRSKTSLRRASIPTNLVQNMMVNQTDHSNQIPPKPVPRKTRTCQVCYEDKIAALYKQPISRQCKHRERTICNECLYRHVAQAFQKMCTGDVRCPELDCKIILDYDAIKKILRDANDTNLLERYDRFCLKHQLEQMPEFIWCAYECGSGQLVDHGVENNIVTCVKCGKKSCFIHRTKWHEGLTCENYDEQTDPGRRATEQWLAQKTKTCSNCQASIEKTTGCDHMTCARCHFEFCWACLANYAYIRQHGNHYHHRHCKHFRPYKI